MTQEERLTSAPWPEGWERDTFKAVFIKLQAREYLTVAQRQSWFAQEQRALIVAGKATQTYSIQIVDQCVDLDVGYAKYRVRIEDVLGNVVEATGSETKADFKDYDEKAFTKAVGRALALMGYSTVDAQDDEGGLIVDSPQPPRPMARPQPQSTPRPPAAPAQPIRAATGNVQTGADALITDRQMTSIRKLCVALNRPEPDNLDTMTFVAARDVLTTLNHAYSEARQAVTQ